MFNILVHRNETKVRTPFINYKVVINTTVTLKTSRRNYLRKRMIKRLKTKVLSHKRKRVYKKRHRQLISFHEKKTII